MTGMGSRIAALLASAAMLLAGGVVPGAYADEPTQAPAAAAAGATVTVSDAESFVRELACDASAPAKTVVVAGDIDVTLQVLPDKVHINVGCPVVLKSDGNPHTVSWETTGSLIASTSSFTVGVSGASGEHAVDGNRLTFTHPADGKNHGPLFHNYGTLTIHGGTFTGLRTDRGGVALNSKTMVVDGGVFRDNVASVEACTPDTPSECMKHGGYGGGAIWSENSLTILGGNALFEHNGATEASYGSGGGAVWAQGTLTIKNDSTGRPTFKGNYATIADPKQRNISTAGILRGGAGGAVFLNGQKSTAYLTGGTFEDNVSGYLGGAVYTELDSTTYVGKAVAESNTAGHFGGGLWLCPSGNSTASKGGNIALFDNHVNAGYDANDANQESKIPEADKNLGADSLTAGSDLAIMNPYWKAIHNWIPSDTVNRFQLLDTWFTDRATAAVQWVWDRTPLTKSSGYEDSWLPDYQQGIEAVLANSKISGLIQEPGAKQAEGLIRLSKDDPDPKQGYLTTGLGLRAEVEGDTDAAKETIRQAARDRAQLTFKGNSARLSGGAFGSNGVVVFDSPYSVDWDKIDASTGEKVTKPSTWLLTTTDEALDERIDPTTGNVMPKTPYFDPDMRPEGCSTDDSQSDCWGHADPTKTDAAYAENMWYVLLTDDSRHDNNPEMGSLSVDNLAPGTYTLEEYAAPAGYEPAKTKFTFTIKATEGGALPDPPVIYILNEDGKPGAEVKDHAIGNTPIGGVLSWVKTDADDKSKQLAGSEWKIQSKNGQGYTDVEKYTKITDRTPDNGETYEGVDTDSKAGAFGIQLGADGLGEGDYRLVETKAPNGYWSPAESKNSHEFTITTDDKTGYKVEWAEGETGNIANTPTEVSWEKVDAGNTDTRLPGSEWSLVRKADGTNGKSEKWTVKDCASADDSSDKCTTSKGALSDADQTAGVIRLTRLDYGTYELVESQAPAGYVKSGKTYTFTITKEEPTTAVEIKDGDSVVTGNKIVNTKALAALPLTGGRSALDWAVAGGVLAVLAVGVAVVRDRLRRRALGL